MWLVTVEPNGDPLWHGRSGRDGCRLVGTRVEAAQELRFAIGSDPPQSVPIRDRDDACQS
jgi:hypothetical protein